MMRSDVIYKYCRCGYRYELVNVFNGLDYVWAFSETVVNQFKRICPECGKVNKPYELVDFTGGCKE